MKQKACKNHQHNHTALNKTTLSMLNLQKFSLSRRVVVEAIKRNTYFSVSYIYSHTNNQTNNTVCNLQLISWAMCTKTCFLPSLTLISWRFGRRPRLKKNRLSLHSSIASSKRNTVQSHQICIVELRLWTKTRCHTVVQRNWKLYSTNRRKKSVLFS